MKKKMFIAGMSLAVALILLATASFAWYTISTAPEVSGMQMALYTSRTLLLAPGDGTDTAPESDEFTQYISLSPNFAGLAPLRPVSTADGINWFLPSYDTESGSISEIDSFILDDSLEHANVSVLDGNGNELTGDALLEAQSRGYYVYTDFWMKTEEDGAKVRLSIPHLYGSTADRHNGTTTEFGLAAEELNKAVYGTYVLGEPELDPQNSSSLKERTTEPETALRVGFLIYQDPETLQPVSETVSSLPFKIYEPNADKRAAGTPQDLLIPDTAGSSVATREQYVAGFSDTSLQSGTYYVTQPIAKSEGEGIELTTVPAANMIVQLASAWDDTSVVKTMNGQWGNSVLKPNSNDVGVFGEFLKLDDSYATAGNTVSLTDTTGKTDIAGSNIIVELDKNTPIRVRLFVWLEGQDVDCWNDIAAGTFRINLELAGESIYKGEGYEPEAEEADPVTPPLTTCTLKGYDGGEGWFDSLAAGISRSEITEIEIRKTVPHGMTDFWDAGTESGENGIRGCIEGTKVYLILPEGAEKISLPQNSDSIFSCLTACRRITGLDLVDTSAVTNMEYMFKHDFALEGLDLSGFNTANVTNMGAMFGNCEKLRTLDLSAFNTSKVTQMESMFNGCKELSSVNLSSFDTGKVTNMISMFANCNALQSLDLSGFNTSSVVNMGSMFCECTALTELDLTGFNTTGVTKMDYMFDQCSALTSLDISSFDNTSVDDVSHMFAYCSNLTTIYAGPDWSPASVTGDTDMFYGDTKLVGGNNTAYDPAHVGFSYARIDMPGNPGYFTDNAGDPAVVIGTLKGYGTNGDSSDGWFDRTEAGIYRNRITALEFVKNVPTGYTATWNAGTGTGAEEVKAYLKGTTVSIVLPAGADKIALPKDSKKIFSSLASCTSIDGTCYLDTSAVTDMSEMFEYSFDLTSLDVSGFDTSAVTDMRGMFKDCRSLTSLNVGGFDTSAVTDMSMMFSVCSKLTELDVGRFDTSKVTDMYAMFYYCSSLTSLDVSSFATSKVTDMNSTFSGCQSLTRLDVSGFATSKVTSMYGMFNGCSGLTGLDLSGFDTSKVGRMDTMFNGCSCLTTIYAGGGLTTSSVTKSNDMFTGCTALVGGNGTTYSASNTDKTYARIDGGTASPGYFTAK